MVIKTSGVVAATATATVAALVVGGSAAMGAVSSGFDGQGQPGPGTTAALAAARAATAALPHSPQLLRELAGRVSPSMQGSLATGTAVRGIDVAAFQHPRGVAIKWASVAAAGYRFAAVKATEGNYYVNPWAVTDLAAAKAARLYVTAYHFAIPNVSGAAAQARFAVRSARYATGGRMLPLMLDIEYDPYVNRDHTNQCYGLSHAKMTAWIAAFVSAARSLTGQLPVIYTTAGWWRACAGGSTAFGADPMWVAAYGIASPPLPAGWRTWTFWQYTSGGTVPGVDSPGSTDLSRFNARVVGLIDPGNQRSRAGARVALQVNALDTLAGQPVRFTAKGLPPRLAISGAGKITGTPGGPARTYRVTVSARNPVGAAASVSFSWLIS